MSKTILVILSLVSGISIAWGWGIQFKATPEQIHAKANIEQWQRDQKQRHKLELLEAQTALEVAKTPQQRYDEAVEAARIACQKEADEGSLSAGEYIGLKLIGF